MNSIQFVADDYDVLEGADALAICTEWSIFRTPDFENESFYEATGYI